MNGGSRRSVGQQILRGSLAALGLLALVFGFAIYRMASRCVVQGTLVETPEGPRRVESLQVGDPVVTLGPSGPELGWVVAISRHHTLRHLEMRFSDGSALAVTPSHPIATGSRWQPAGTLEPGSAVLSASGNVQLTDVRVRYGPVTVYDLTVQPRPSFIANGVLVHNKGFIPHQSVAIGRIRTMIAGQAAYEDLNEYFDVPDCLAQPATCRSVPPDQPRLLDESFLLETHMSYLYSFHPGPPVPIEHVRELGLSPTSLESFAYVAVPEPELRDRGCRAFCGDSRGLICEVKGGATPQVERGQCVLAEDPDDGCVILGR